MESPKLEAQIRETVRKGVGQLRREGALPAVVYGAGLDSLPIQLDAHEATRLLSRTSRSTLIELDVGDETHAVLVREVQRDVIRGDYLHVDFLKVALDELIRANVRIELVGEAPASQEAGGVLVTGASSIEVEALPADLPDRVEADLSVLENIDDTITVGDLHLEGEVTILTDPNELVARVIYQAEEVIEVEAPEEELEEVLEGEELEEVLAETEPAPAEDEAEGTEEEA